MRLFEDVDTQLEEVLEWLKSHRNFRELIATGAEQAIDEVIDGRRTGRWSVDQLEKTEKIYIGTKIEIVVRTALKLERVGKLDTLICGHPVDFKWSIKSVWELPQEAMGEICLVIGGRKKFTLIDVGLVRPSVSVLNAGRNQDKKGTLSKSGRGGIRWLEQGIPLKPSFLSSLDPEIRKRVMAGRSGQERVTELFALVPMTPIPRLAIETVAQQKDPMRRLRADKIDRLRGMKIFSSRYGKARLIRLGFAELDKDEFVGVPQEVLAKLKR